MNNANDRLHSLDGLRGLAILFVFLNHLTPKYLIATFPILDQIGVFSSGIAGVSFLFIISGFLMSFLYPLPQNKFQFLQKRYARIFPLFMTMSAAMIILSLLPSLVWWARICIILFLALFVHVLWVYGIRKIPLSMIPKLLFFGLFILQFAVGGFYLLWIMRQPPIVLQQMPELTKNFFTFLVNTTLTFPLGNYIPMLDGVYWSLAAEILFYVLYPFFIVPLITYLIPQKRAVKILFLLTLLPLFGGIDILSRHIFSLSTLQFSLFYYFAFGILMGYLYRNHAHLFTRFSKSFSGYFTILPIIFFIILLIVQHLISALLPSSYSPWIRLFSAFPFAVIFAFALDKGTSLYRLFSTKILVFMGTISYSLYLCHSAIVHLAEDTHMSGSLLEDIYTLIITLTLSILLASILYFLLERPYFQRDKRKAVLTLPTNPHPLWGKSIWIGFSIVYLFAIFLSFQSTLNLSSLILPQTPNAFLPISPTNTTISLQTTPIKHIKISATENNLGIIYLSVNHIHPEKILTNPPMLIFTLQQEGNTKPLVTIPYVLDEFRGVDFPFGFPIISDSKGKTYVASFSLVPSSKDNYVTLDMTSVKTVYQINKSSYLKNPQLFLHIALSKMQNVFTNQLSLLSFFLLVPFLALGLYLLVIPSKSKQIQHALVKR